MRLQVKAKDLLNHWKGEAYSFGPGCLESAGRHAAALGRSALVIASESRWLRPALDQVIGSLSANSVELAGGPVPGAAPNAPRGDVLRLAKTVSSRRPEVIVAVGGGSTIDAAKAAAVLAALDCEEATIETLFGTGMARAALDGAGVSAAPVVAVQTASSSAAHLTKYSNITDLKTGQKKLIVDDTLTPPRAVFDYDLTHSMPPALTADGAFDGIAHCLEVLYGAPAADLEEVNEIAHTGVELLVKYLPAAVDDSADGEARVALGLGTDLGGYAIMVGGTNGPHLNSFSLVDVAPHGRACAILNPYWTVFFAPAIERRLAGVAEIYKRYGYLHEDLEQLRGRQLGEAVARAMIALSRKLGYPWRLEELPGWDSRYIEQALRAAADPQLSMKLRNMPVALEAGSLETYMRPVLEAAASGDLGLIPAVQAPVG